MAHRWYLIADSRKFGKISIYPVADIGQIHTLITDRLPEHYAESLAEQNVQVIQCLS
jgi:DeoR/GlpR family transcriptional regulator of sugar metabolism